VIAQQRLCKSCGYHFYVKNQHLMLSPRIASKRTCQRCCGAGICAPDRSAGAPPPVCLACRCCSCCRTSRRRTRSCWMRNCWSSTLRCARGNKARVMVQSHPACVVLCKRTLLPLARASTKYRARWPLPRDAQNTGLGVHAQDRTCMNASCECRAASVCAALVPAASRAASAPAALLSALLRRSCRSCTRANSRFTY